MLCFRRAGDRPPSAFTMSLGSYRWDEAGAARRIFRWSDRHVREIPLGPIGCSIDCFPRPDPPTPATGRPPPRSTHPAGPKGASWRQWRRTTAARGRGAKWRGGGRHSAPTGPPEIGRVYHHIPWGFEMGEGEVFRQFHHFLPTADQPLPHPLAPSSSCTAGRRPWTTGWCPWTTCGPSTPAPRCGPAFNSVAPPPPQAGPSRPVARLPEGSRATTDRRIRSGGGGCRGALVLPSFGPFPLTVFA